MNKSFIGSLIAVLVLTGATAFFLSHSNPLFSFPVLMGGSVLMFLITAGSFLIIRKTFRERPQAFVRGVMGGTMLKFFTCIIAIVTYALLNKEHLYKPQLFVLLGIYAVYSVVETVMLSRMAKTNT